MATNIGQYAPVFLPGETRPFPDRGAWQATGPVGWQKVRHYRCNPVHIETRFFFACGSSAPVRVEREGDAAAWLAGTLLVPILQGPGLPLLQVLWPYQSFFEPLVAGDQKTFLASLPGALPIQALRGLLCLGSFSVVGHIRHIKGPPWWGPTL